MDSNLTGQEVEVIIKDISNRGIKLLEVKQQIKDLIDVVEGMKSYIDLQMTKVGVDELIIPVGEVEVVLRQYNRSTRRLDKQKLSEIVSVPTKDLNYYGVSKIVEDGVLTSDDIKELHKEHSYSFVVAREREIKNGKRKD